VGNHVLSTRKHPEGPQLTLGDLLYSEHRQNLVPERDWAALMQSIATGNQYSLYVLYEWAHRIVFTLILRLTGKQKTAEELTIDVFYDLWHRASTYDATDGTVIAWIMNQARESALSLLRPDPSGRPGAKATERDPREPDHFKKQADLLGSTLAALTPGEMQAIEQAFFGEMTQAEVAQSLGQSPETICTRISSGLKKLSNLLGKTKMRSRTDCGERSWPHRVSLYALQALPVSEMSAAAQHIYSCSDCREEMNGLRPVVDAFVFWPTDVLRPTGSLWPRLSLRLAAVTGAKALLPERGHWEKPEWIDVANGISCKFLTTDREAERVSMLVRLAPRVDYPPHRHAGLEELHLLHGELWIDERKLYPGDYNRADPGTSDKRVWSETGCTCLLSTSTNDLIG
jgi:RNA polymerase sigma-70 factor (ECF subfamily)